MKKAEMKAILDRVQPEYVKLAKDHATLQHDYALLRRDLEAAGARNYDLMIKCAELQNQVEGIECENAHPRTVHSPGMLDQYADLEDEVKHLRQKVKGYESVLTARGR